MQFSLNLAFHVGYRRFPLPGVGAGARQHGFDGPGAGARVGARPHLCVRRRPRPGYHWRQQRRRRQRQPAAVQREGPGPLPPGHPAERTGAVVLGPGEDQRIAAQQGDGRQGRLRDQPALRHAAHLPQEQERQRHSQRLPHVCRKLEKRKICEKLTIFIYLFLSDERKIFLGVDRP